MKGDWTRHPWEEETEPRPSDFNADAKYSWVKAPSFMGKPAQVGPLANVLAMYVSGNKDVQKYTNLALEKVSALAGIKAGIPNICIQLLEDMQQELSVVLHALWSDEKKL